MKTLLLSLIAFAVIAHGIAVAFAVKSDAAEIQSRVEPDTIILTTVGGPTIDSCKIGYIKVPEGKLYFNSNGGLWLIKVDRKLNTQSYTETFPNFEQQPISTP
jgi:hypothetical protein